MDEHLTDDELAFHRKVVADIKAAQAAWSSWSQHIAGKYELKDGEGVAEDGTIHRSPKPDAGS